MRPLLPQWFRPRVPADGPAAAHAPNRLFWVTRVVEARPSGSVAWIAPDLLRGYRGGSHHDVQGFDAGLWLRLCRNARRAFAERDALRTA